MLLEDPPNKGDRGKVLIDGDIIAYRAAYSAENGSERDAMQKVHDVMRWVVGNTCYSSEVEDYHVYLTGQGNFRYDIAQFRPYKGNRSAREKPFFLGFTRDYMMDVYEATMAQGEEADDLIAIEATRLGPSTVVASIDKDMLQIPCFHYNFKRDEWHSVSEFEGLQFFYSQILMGDTADNIIGLQGIGPVKSKKMLEDCETEDELWEAVLNAYSGDIDRVIENARLLWLRRKQEELWEPPTAKEEPEQSKKDTDQD